MDNVVDVLPAVDPAPQRPNRKAWKEKEARGKGRTGKPLPKPGTEAEVRKHLDKLAVEALNKVVKNEPTLNAAERDANAFCMSSRTRAAVLEVLGEDIEQARSYFADRMLAVAHKIVDRIERDIEELPPSSLGFNAAVMIDKSEALRSKHGTSAKGAQVAQQVNLFMDGSVDREKIIAQLTGAALQPSDPIPVEVVGAPSKTAQQAPAG